MILVVDDEADLVKLLSFNLEKEGYVVRPASTGREAIEAALKYLPDLIILDVMLPEIDGLEVCRRLRNSPKTASIPILMLSARKEELDKVVGLELGADDYVIKPFSIREVIARIRAMLRRYDRNTDTGQATPHEEVEQQIMLGEIALYPESYRVTIKGEPCSLTHKEFSLLKLLMANAGKVMTREVLLDRVWDYGADIDTRTVDVHIRYLRQKIEPDPADPIYIETVRSVGYRFIK